jgi:hypothetical protein
MTKRIVLTAIIAGSFALIGTSASAQSTGASTPKDTTRTIQGDTSKNSRSQDAELERRAERARRGGGLRVGAWSVKNSATGSPSVSSTPAFEGFYRHGLDLHLAFENSIGFWRRRQTTSGSGGVLGGVGSSTVDDYVIPQYTSLLFFPMTRPEQHFEPYLRGGIGLTIGAEDDAGKGGGGVSLVPGIGTTGGVGFEWRAAEALGVTASARYQWVRFFNDFGGRRTYEGPAFDVGLTYRFQYR